MDDRARGPDDHARVTSRRMSVRALVLGERVDTAGLERKDALSTAPLFFRVGEHGFAAVFRYGVVVLIGLTPLEEDPVIAGLATRVSRPAEARDEETAAIEAGGEGEDRVDPDGVIRLVDASPERLLVVADAMAKAVAVDYDERRIAAVFEEIEPWARELAELGRRRGKRSDTLRLIGRALFVQHRVSERVAVAEKPDILWDRPDLERLYARLETEFDLEERAEILNRKLSLIGDTARLLTDLIDTERSYRLELAVVLLIVGEIALTLWQIISGLGHP
ncbi:MAG TPA: RMD1 family protein [Caulobacteraceae bacterium]|nr:RMD1 family protein [Caulobacteraceae bacterium]